MRSTIHRIFHLLLALGVASVSLAGMGKAQAVSEKDITKGCSYGAGYNIAWSVFTGAVVFQDQGRGYLRAYGNIFPFRYGLYNAQDNVSGYPGPGYRGVNTTGTYRIVFTINNIFGTNEVFDGYVIGYQSNAMAGVTWLNNTPFGFYATYGSCIIG